MKKIIPVLFLATLFGCSEDDSSDANCDSQIRSLVNQLGQPEEINRYDTSDGYHSHDYWYWCRGFERTFTWGTNVDGCRTSDYTFDPICSN